MVVKSKKIFSTLLIILAVMIAFTCTFFTAGEEAEAGNGFVVFIAPGHTPAENFSRGGISEGQLNEQLSVAIGNALRNAGYTVYLTNKLKWTATDLPVILTEEPTEKQYSYGYQLLPAIEHPENYGVNDQCDLVLSVHHNAAYNSDGSDSSATGLRFYYNSNYSTNTAYPHMNYGRNAESARVSKIAAEAITNHAASEITYTNTRSVVDINGTSVSNSICRNCTMASVLIEAGFLTSPTDLAAARQPANQQALANSIVNAINSVKDQIGRNKTGTLTLPGTVPGDEVFVDGTPYIVGLDGKITVTNGKLATVYSYNTTEKDKHSQYPTGMTVYNLSYSNGTYVPTQNNDLTNIMDYVGTSIRITGNQGIRIITGIPTAKKNALAGSGLGGYKMIEDGLVVGWASELNGKPLTLNTTGAKSASAYVRGSKDPYYSKDNDWFRYTNVLTFTDMAKTNPDLIMRSYMKVQDSAGNTIVLYGGYVQRSIYYIAQQNQNTFKPGTAQYNYIWNILNYNGTKTPMMGSSEVTKNQMINYFISKAKAKGIISNKNTGVDQSRDAQGFPNYYKTVGVNSLSDFVQIYIEEAQAEGLRPDVAFAQMLNETGYLNFGGDVRITQFNFAGIGATGGGVQGNQFADVRTGIRAQIQHLKAYGSTEGLKNACVDPRYKYVEPKGKAPYVELLSGTWAANPSYGTEIVNLINAMKAASDVPVVSMPLMSAMPNLASIANSKSEEDLTEDITEEEVTKETDTANIENAGSSSENTDGETEQSADNAA